MRFLFAYSSTSIVSEMMILTSLGRTLLLDAIV